MNILNTLKSIFGHSIEISGDWIGHYGFGEGYSHLVRKQTVDFVAKIKKGDRGSFTGTIKEGDNGIPESADISGVVRGRRVSFTKTYKSSYQIDEDGVIAKLSYGPHHVIYKGFYDKSKSRFYGQWRIETTYEMEDGQKIEHINEGIWEMSRGSAAH